MKKVFILALLVSTVPAFAGEVDHFPSKEELIPGFTESFQSKREKAKEYYQGDQARIDATIKANTVSQEDIERTAQFSSDALKRQGEICLSLQGKFPKTKGASCITGVLMVSGLGHADDQKMIMEMLANKETAAQMRQQLSQVGEQEKYALDSLKKGINPKLKEMDADRNREEVMSALGLVSQMTWLRQQLNKAPVAAAPEAAPAAQSAE